MRIFTYLKFRSLLLFIFVILFSIQGFCITITSTGTGGNWSSPATWVGGVIPGSSDDVVIAADASVVVDVNAECASLLLNKDRNTSSLSLIISGTNTLNVLGNAIINGNSPTTTLSIGSGILNVGGYLNIIAPPGEADLTLSGGVINVSGDFKLTNGSGDGSGIGAGKVRDVNGTGAIYLGGVLIGTGDISPNVVIQNYTGSFPLDYYRSKVSGDWSNIVSWESSHNGSTNWVNATKIPDAASKLILVQTGHVITLDNNVPASNLIVNSNGILNCSAFQITGPGPFALQAGATIITNHADGLGSTGSILVDGSKTFSSLANYEFKGASTGVFTTSTPGTCNNVTINNASGVNLSLSLAVNGILNITGKFNIGSHTLKLNGNITGTNASNGLVGSANSDLIIGGTTGDLNLGFNQENTSARTIKNYTQSRNATVFLTDSLQLTGLLTLSGTDSKLESGANAYLRLVSTATSLANVAPLLNNTDITGNVKVESWLTGGNINMRFTRLTSSPVNDNLTASGNKVYQQLKKYLVITGPGGSAKGFDLGNGSQTYAVTVTRYYEPGNLSQPQFDNVQSLLNNEVPVVKPGEGFLLFFRGNRDGFSEGTRLTSNKVNPPFAVPESFAITYTGELNKKSISVTLSKAGHTEAEDKNDGLNLIGNPYAATIDFSLLYSTNSAIIGSYYSLPKPDKTGTMTYDVVSGILVNPGSTLVTEATARYIQPGQAFYVVKKNVGTEIYPAFFTENMKATASSPARLLSVPLRNNLQTNTSMSLTPMVSNAKVPWPALRMSLQDHVNTDETVLLFKEGYQKGYEGADVPYFSGSTVSLSTLSSDNRSLAINFMPDLKEMREIKLNFNASASGRLKLNFTDISAIHGYQVFLRDNYISQTALTEIHLNSVYEFSIDQSVAASYGANRLALIIKPEKNEQLKLESFTASPVNHFSHLKWTIQNEINPDHYEVERSSDNKSFNKIGEVKANAQSSLADYSLIDKSPLEGENYYRLKSVFGNGIISISESILVTMNHSVSSAVWDNKLAIEVYPNPGESEIFVKINSAIKSDVIISIFDLHGKRLQKLKFSKNSIIKSDISLLREGLYLLEIRNSLNNKVIGNAKFYKN